MVPNTAQNALNILKGIAVSTERLHNTMHSKGAAISVRVQMALLQNCYRSIVITLALLLFLDILNSLFSINYILFTYFPGVVSGHFVDVL